MKINILYISYIINGMKLMRIVFKLEPRSFYGASRVMDDDDDVWESTWPPVCCNCVVSSGYNTDCRLAGGVCLSSMR